MNRDAFEQWFASEFGPTPPPAWALVNLAAAAKIEATKAGAWAAWCHLQAVAAGQHQDDARRAEEAP